MADFNVVFDRSILSDITSLGPRSCSAYDLGGLLEWDFFTGRMLFLSPN